MDDIKMNEESDFIYLRDVDSSLSPASVSLLMNGYTELKKDVVATILSLISKKQLIIDDEQKIVDSKNESNLSNLTPDELYVYWWIIGKEAKFDEEHFMEIIDNNLRGYVCTEAPYSGMVRFMSFIVVIILLSMIITGAMGKQSMLHIILPPLIGIIIVIGIIYLVIKSNTSEKINSRLIYTEKGSKEVLNWDRYRKFLEDFGRMQDYELESIIIWDRYLAYAVALNISKEYKNIRIKNSGSKTILNIDNDINKEVERRFIDEGKQL